MPDFLSINRGVRQGCPLSPYLFILCIEVLSATLLKDQDITGIKINGKEFKSTMFADDATFAMDGSLKSFRKLIYILDNFKLISGLRLNVNKTIILKIGSLRYANIHHLKHLKFEWTSESAKTLGIVFSNEKSKLLENNLMPKLNDFINCLKRWNHRKLTLMGKITVVKTFALPKLIYPLTVLDNPSEEIITTIKTSIFKFIWNSKPEKIKRTVLMQDYKNGGLRLTNIDYFIEALKAGWLRRIFDENNKGLWKEYYLEKINKFGGRLILECNIHSYDCKQIAQENTFLRDVLLGWSKINNVESTDVIAKEIIWNNSQIKCDNKLIFYQQWFEKGIKFIEHIYDFRSRNFYTIEQLKNLYNVSLNDFLKYHNIVSNIKSDWKRKLKHEDVRNLPLRRNKTLCILTQEKQSITLD